MIIELQQLKTWAKSSMENAEKQAEPFKHNQLIVSHTEGIVWAFSKTIEMLDFLLNAEAGTDGQKDCKNDGNAM